MIEPIDGSLATTSYFSAAELANRSAALLPRWADVHFQEIERDLPMLMVQRDRYSDLAYRATIDAINQYEFDTTEKIHNDEIAAGWYTIQSDVAACEEQSQVIWSKAATDASKTITDAINTTILNWDLQDPERLASYKANVAYASMFSIYNQVHKANAPTGAQGEFIWISGDLMEGPLTRPKVMTAEAGGTQTNTHPVPDVLWNTVRAATLPETIYNFATINSQKILADGSARSAQQMLSSKQLLADWNKADVQFRRARTQLALDVNAMRHDARQAPRGPMNTAEQLNAMKANFADHLADVYVRCSTVAAGLRAVWGVNGLADPPNPSAWNDDQGSFLDAIAAYVSSLRRRFGELSSREGNTVISLSLVSLIGAKAWSDAIAAADTAKNPWVSWSFALPDTILGQLKSKRVRGTIAYFRGATDAAAGVWRATIRPPARAASALAGTTVLQDTPVVDLSRVQTRENPKPPDIVGLASLRNIVPGTVAGATTPADLWTLTLAMKSLRGVSATKLTDIELDLMLAGSQ